MKRGMEKIDNLNRDVAVFINDFFSEIPPALDKLAHKLDKPLQGIMLVDKNAKARGKTHPIRDADFKEVVCDFSDESNLHSTIKQFENRLLFVNATSERGQPYFKRILPHVPYVPAPTESSLEWATHKGKMRQMLASYDSSLVPHTRVISDDSDMVIAQLLGDLKLPYIVKPTGLAASILVNKVNDEAELRATLHHSLQVIHDIYAREAGRGTPELIIEEFMEGDMYSIDLYISQDGKAWALQPIRCRTAYSIGLEGFYMYQRESDLEINAETIESGKQAAIKAAHALGLRSCTAHVELYLTPYGWKIIELGPRPGGHRQFMYEKAYGIDHAYNEFLVKAGLEPEELNSQPHAYVAVPSIYSPEEGIIEAIEGIDQARSLSSVVNLELHASLGDTVSPSGKGGSSLIDAELSNTDKIQLDRDIAELRELITIRIRPHEQAI